MAPLRNKCWGPHPALTHVYARVASCWESASPRTFTFQRGEQGAQMWSQPVLVDGSSLCTSSFPLYPGKASGRLRHIQQHWKVGAEQSRAFPPAPIPSTSSASGSFWSSQAGNAEPREPPTPTFSLIFPQQVNLHPFRALKSIIFTFAVDSLALLLMKTSRKAPQIQL